MYPSLKPKTPDPNKNIELYTGFATVTPIPTQPDKEDAAITIQRCFIMIFDLANYQPTEQAEFLHILGEWRPKEGEREAQVTRKRRSIKNPAGFFSVPHLTRNWRFMFASRLPCFRLYSPKICKKSHLFCRLANYVILWLMITLNV